jgi:hypothetical protein
MSNNSNLDCRKANNCMTPYCSCDLLHTRAPQAASDSVTISRESLLRASWIVEEYTKDKVFTAHESGMVIEMKAEIKQALKP